MPQLGEFLGDFTNELDCDDFITEFASGGPKNYCYKTNSGYTDCTVKGYPINYLTDLSLNFESIKYTVTENRNNKIKIPQLKFVKDKSEWLQDKFYRFVYDKRVINDDFTTSPFGL